MGKASRRKKERRKRKEKEITKRRFNYKTLLVTGIALFSLLYTDTRKLPEKQSYIALKEDEKQEIYRKVKPVTDSLAQEINKQKKYGIVTNIEVKLKDRKQYYEFFNKEDISDKINQAKETLDHALKFWEHPKLNKPVIKFVMSNNPKEIEKPTNNIIKIYPLKDTGESLYLDMFFITQSDTILGELSYLQNEAGSVEGSIDIKVLKDSLKIDGYRGGIRWNLRLGDIDVLETPSIEILHTQLAPYTHQHIKKKINEKYKEIGEIDYDVISDCYYKEELIVHGIGQLWFEQYNKYKNLGYIIDSLYTRQGKWGEPEVRAMKEKIRDIGIEKSIDLYIDNPDELFK